jgi:hypothetical protein
LPIIPRKTIHCGSHPPCLAFLRRKLRCSHRILGRIATAKLFQEKQVSLTVSQRILGLVSLLTFRMNEPHTRSFVRCIVQVEEAASLLMQRFPMSTVHLLRSLQEVQFSPMQSKQVAHDFLLNIVSKNRRLEANQQQDLMVLFQDTESLTNLVLLLEEPSPPILVEQKCFCPCFCWPNSSFWNSTIRSAALY